MEQRRISVGLDSFEKVRRENFYYVDKSLLIRDLLAGWSEVHLFTRPRRFGKTLNMSMLQAFFEIGADASLFAGLAIEKERALCEQYQGKYPVVFVSLKGVDGADFGEAREKLANVLKAEARRLHFLLDSPKLASFEKKALEELIYERVGNVALQASLELLTDLLYAHYGQRAILLIDEYDVPLDKAYEHGYYREMIDLIRGMFGAALKTNDSLYFAVLTGCLRVSKESIFTGLNNIKVHSITDKRFDEYFGFTDAEVRELLRAYGQEAHYAEARAWYDGYRFGSVEVYCPWDVLNYCYDLCADDAARPQAYWTNTSGNGIIRRLIGKSDTGTARWEIERLVSGEPIRKRLNERLTHGEIDENIENVWSLLYMTGYLTATHAPEGGVYELVIPNREVEEIYINQIQGWFEEKAKGEAEQAELAALYAAMESGDGGKIEEILNEELLESISYYDARETFYHGFLMALLCACARWRVVSNAESGLGRSDILAERRDGKLGFVVEAKAVREYEELDAGCEAAMSQMKEKEYAAPLRRYRVGTIWLYGVAFYGKECRVRVERG